MTTLDILTIMLILVGSFLVWKCRPLTAVCVYLAVIVLYPQHWSFKFGAMPTLFVGKVLIVPLMLNLVFKAKRLSGFRPNVLDGAVVLLLLGQLTAGLIGGQDLWQVIAEQSHYIATETLSYFAVRLSIRSRADLLFFLKALALIGIPLACIAIYESYTGDYVYTKLYCLLSGQKDDPLGPIIRSELRSGFYRAAASFGVHIGLGLFFAACVPLVLCLRNDPSWKWWQMTPVAIILALGLLSTVSSGPLLSFAVSAMVLAYYPLRKSLPIAIPLALGIVVLWQLCAPAWGVAAPTEHLRKFAFNPKNADYRMGLIEEAFTGGMQDHWYVGFGVWGGIGEKKPNPEFNWKHKDVVNIYVAQLVRFGLFGLLPYLAVSLLPFLKLGQAAHLKRYSSDTWLIWCVFAFFMGWQVAFLTVSSIRQIRCLLYLLTGLISSLPDIVRRKT